MGKDDREVGMSLRTHITMLALIANISCSSLVIMSLLASLINLAEGMFSCYLQIVLITQGRSLLSASSFGRLAFLVLVFLCSLELTIYSFHLPSIIGLWMFQRRAHDLLTLCPWLVVVDTKFIHACPAAFLQKKICGGTNPSCRSACIISIGSVLVELAVFRVIPLFYVHWLYGWLHKLTFFF